MQYILDKSRWYESQNFNCRVIRLGIALQWDEHNGTSRYTKIVPTPAMEFLFIFFVLRFGTIFGQVGWVCSLIKNFSFGKWNEFVNNIFFLFCCCFICNYL